MIGEVILHDTPMFHVGGLPGAWSAAARERRQCFDTSILGARDKRYVANYWRFVEKYRVTRLSGVPTTLAVLAKSPPERRSLFAQALFHHRLDRDARSVRRGIRADFRRAHAQLLRHDARTRRASRSIRATARFAKKEAPGIRLPYTQIRAAALANWPGARHPPRCAGRTK